MKNFLLRSMGVADVQAGQTASLPACLEMVLQRSDALMQGVLDGLLISSAPAQRPVGLASKVAPSSAAIEFLMSQAPAVKKSFVKRVSRSIYQPVTQDAQDQTAVRFEDLQLLDSSQIDGNIEFALAQQEVDRSVDEVLPALNALVSSLLGWTTVQGSLNPMKPQAFVRALQETLLKHAPDALSRSALILPAAGLLGIGLRQLYKEIIAWLRAQGVEPAASAATLAGRLSRAGEGFASDDGNSLVRRVLTMDKLRRLLSGELDDAPSPGFLHTMPASFVAMEDLKLIEPMMRRLSERAAALGKEPKTPRARKSVSIGLTATTDEPQGKQLGRQLTQEVVGMMVERLSQDNRLLPPVSRLIRSLEPLLLALAQNDPRFFSERQHPARLLLDRVMDQSLAFGSEAEDGFASFLTTISNAAASLSASKGGSDDFAVVLQTLEAGWARDEAAHRQQLEDAARALLHAEQRNLLAQRRADEFKVRMQDKTVPDWLSTFLRGPWSQVVAQAELACKDGRSDPGGYVELVDELLWSVQTEQTRHNRPRLVGLVPSMLIKLRQGLQVIDFSSDRLSVIFDALITEHEKAFEGPRMGELSATDDGVDPALEFDADDSPRADAGSLWMATSEALESGYLTEDAHPADDSSTYRVFSARDLSVGVWVELIVEGQWLRAQLTWASPHRTLFMFVARGGTAHSMSRRTMARLRMQGAIRVVSEGHLVDKALDAVAHAALRNDSEGGRNRH